MLPNSSSDIVKFTKLNRMEPNSFSDMPDGDNEGQVEFDCEPSQICSEPKLLETDTECIRTNNDILNSQMAKSDLFNSPRTGFSLLSDTNMPNLQNMQTLLSSNKDSQLCTWSSQPKSDKNGNSAKQSLTTFSDFDSISGEPTVPLLAGEMRHKLETVPKTNLPSSSLTRPNTRYQTETIISVNEPNFSNVEPNVSIHEIQTCISMHQHSPNSESKPRSALSVNLKSASSCEEKQKNIGHDVISSLSTAHASNQETPSLPTKYHVLQKMLPTKKGKRKTKSGKRPLSETDVVNGATEYIKSLKRKVEEKYSTQSEKDMADKFIQSRLEKTLNMQADRTTGGKTDDTKRD